MEGGERNVEKGQKVKRKKRIMPIIKHVTIKANKQETMEIHKWILPSLWAFVLHPSFSRETEVTDEETMDDRVRKG